MTSYMFIVPMLGWLSAVIAKTIVNFCFCSRHDLRLSFANGGFPSEHTATVISAATYIGFYDNFSSTAFLLAECMAFIVMIDATHLRRSLGRHAAILNKLQGRDRLPEREGHTYFEVTGGFIFGFVVGYLCYLYI